MMTAVTTTANNFRVAAVFLLSLFVTGTYASGSYTGPMCCLCSGCSNPLTSRADLFVNSQGVTCTTLALAMANPNNDSTAGNAQCTQLQTLFRSMCCDASFTPPIIPQQATKPPKVKMTRGNQPTCHICADGSYPGKPYTLTASLFIPGTPTCRELYWMGRKGNIPARMCMPLQEFMQTPCGCPAYAYTAPPTKKHKKKNGTRKLLKKHSVARKKKEQALLGSSHVDEQHAELGIVAAWEAV